MLLHIEPKTRHQTTSTPLLLSHLSENGKVFLWLLFLALTSLSCPCLTIPDWNPHEFKASFVRVLYVYGWFRGGRGFVRDHIDRGV